MINIFFFGFSSRGFVADPQAESVLTEEAGLKVAVGETPLLGAEIEAYRKSGKGLYFLGISVFYFLLWLYSIIFF
ncbi:MAG: hypothetical protein NTV32_02140 [Gammaproteobacteria bacterium]|nr:hypothetical protein [Gammaproteobacteria bacterium]